jgi:2-polyprenyl-3-methyl-5-hydroxy-6-metoxy-1,4-benzoquinol methylase
MELLARCPLCGEERAPEHFITCRDHLVSGENFNIVQCVSCSLLYVNPRPQPDDLEAYYQSIEYISHTDRKGTLQERIYHLVRNHMLQKKKQLVEKLVSPPRRLLDVGCGTGAFLEAIKSADNEIIGFEPNTFAREKALEKGIEVLGKEDALETLPENSMHLITLWHVLEHLPDFREKIQLFHSLLAPGGYLVLAVPMWKSFDAGFYGQHWAAWDVPRHLLHFEEKTLVKACHDAGFVFARKAPLAFDSFYVSLLSEQQIGNAGLMAPLRAMMVGAWSNLMGALGKSPWSSQIYVFKKA